MGAAGVAGQLTGTEAKNLNSGLFRLNVGDPLIALNLRQQAGRTNVLANPRIRVKSKEKARIHIGDKVPVITTTAGATGFVSESVNYLDVGLKLEVEPVVNLEDDVGIKIGLEVSNISSEVKTTSGTVAYQVGTRNANTTLRLRDGETQVLAGLISDEDRRSAVRVPGVSRLPLIGRLFSNNNDTVNKTEIVLLITPRVIRNIERPGARLEEFNSGTEFDVGRGGSAVPLGPVSVQPDAPAPKPEAPKPEAPRAPAAGPAPAAAAARAAAQAVKGFTLIELLIVVAIVALLASVAAPLAELGWQRGKEQDLRHALREIRGAIDAYKRAADDGQIEKQGGRLGLPADPRRAGGRRAGEEQAAGRQDLLPATCSEGPDHRRGLGPAQLCQPRRRAAGGQGRVRRVLAQRGSRPEPYSVPGMVT